MKKYARRHAFKWIFWCAALMALWLTRVEWLGAAGRWLVVETPLRGADAIYVFAGGEDERTPYAAELLKRGLAPVVITGSSEISGPFRSVGMRFDETHMNAWALIHLGVPARRIVMLPYGTSTFEELVQLRGFAEKRHFRRVILVSSPFHMRRILMSAHKVFRGSDIELMYAPCKPSALNLNAWWHEERGLIAVQNEYMKLMFYWMKYLR